MDEAALCEPALQLLADTRRWGMPSNWGEYPARVIDAFRIAEAAAQEAEEVRAEHEATVEAEERKLLKAKGMDV